MNIEELLSMPDIGKSFEDHEWRILTTDILVAMPDDYLVETLRIALIAAAARVAGFEYAIGNLPSAELVEEGLKKTLRLLKESINA